MKCADHPTFEAEFPETFNWNLVDSHKIEPICMSIVRLINEDLKRPIEDRTLVLGLRQALIEVSVRTDVFEGLMFEECKKCAKPQNECDCE